MFPIAVVFCFGYVLIAFEGVLKIHKTAIALVLGCGSWVMRSWMCGEFSVVNLDLGNHVKAIAELSFFLLGAMIIVEAINTHDGFRFVTDRIRTKSKVVLFWQLSFLTFFLSAVLDNLTTAIVMISLAKLLIPERGNRLLMSGMIVVAANAGGVWSPIGDVTTTMLWMGGHISALAIIKSLFFPALISMLIPLCIFSFDIRGDLDKQTTYPIDLNSRPGSILVFILGMLVFVSIPLFKAFFHLPPYLGMLFGLGFFWLILDLFHHRKRGSETLRMTEILTRIDVPSILFFVGILLAVSALDSAHFLSFFGHWIQVKIINMAMVVTVLGLISSFVDNVPLVAGAMGMYPLSLFPIDSSLWHLLAYSAGTGGSLLIVGSAAGVVAMGMEKIEFEWYFRTFFGVVLLGYFAGVLTYFGMLSFF